MMKRSCCCLCVLVFVAATAAAPFFAAAADAAQTQATQLAYHSLSPTTTPSSSIDYTGPGPCGVDDARDAATVVLPPEMGCGGDCVLSLWITAPAIDDDGTNSNGNSSACERPPAGWPVLFFYPGFELRASFYDSYASRLASWGWAVVRYDLALLRPVSALAQAGYVAHIIAKLAELSAGDGGGTGSGNGGGSGENSAARWRGAFDVATLAAAGHSRGGKVAALHLAGATSEGTAAAAAPYFTAGYLVDPVDSDFGPSDPAAAPLLKLANRAFGLAAAGVRGRCNPEARTRGFWDAAAPGSWREALLRAGHADLADVAPAFERRALDLLCGRGGDARGAAVELALPPMVAWLDAATAAAKGGGAAAGDVGSRPPRPSRRRRRRRRVLATDGQLPDSFWDWIATQQLAGEIEFDIKKPERFSV